MPSRHLRPSGSDCQRSDQEADRPGLPWRYTRALSLVSRLVTSSPTPYDDSTGDDEARAAEDHRLIRDFLAGREGADAAMASRLEIIPRILGALSRRLAFPMQRHDLEDTAQDAMAIALRKLGQLRPHVPLDAWLHRLCTFELSNSMRRRGRRRDEAVTADLASREGAAIQQIERRELLFAALEQLRPDDAHIVRLHHLEGRTLAEIAVQLQVTDNVIKGRYYRAITRLTDILRHHRPGRVEP